MDGHKSLGRLTGLTYLVVVGTGLFSLMYVPAALSGSGAPQSRVEQLLANPGLYNAGTAAFLIEQAAFCVLPILFYRLLHHAGRWAASVMAVLALASVPVALVGVVERVDAVNWLTNTKLSAGEAGMYGHALACMALYSWDHTLLIASLFWGLWLAPMGYLITVSRTIPRLFGYLLMLGSAGYVVDVFGQLLLPDYSRSMFSDYATVPAALGEIGTCLWLLVFGASHERAPTPDPTVSIE
ncbi:DUF4386 domain-containing protein [Dyella sp. 333MFSha]|uniref:DUF4386 domain-containing protein n=1 Tax=Dyella sp. 333MFSha TaxID=1798240 RepID=UPI000885F71C|nr:DUF4386 domain-containing protein [Dyella sp. 333MFSha]SDG01381.1 protein of unknown function [Dyella sp. 333MFSha]